MILLIEDVDCDYVSRPRSVLPFEGRENHYHSKVEAYSISVVAPAAHCPLCCAMLAFHSAKAAITNGGLIYQRLEIAVVCAITRRE